MPRYKPNLVNPSRRDALALLATFAISRVKGADGPLRFAALDHVEFTVSDLEQSLAFYTRIFGASVMKNNRTTRRYIQLGPAYIALDKAAQTTVDHFCAGIDGFDVASVHAFLQQHGVAYRDFPSGKDLAVADPDGTRTQLAASKGWDLLKTGTASAEAVNAPAPIFHPTGLDHILINVADPEKSAAFYEKIFGPVVRRNNNRTWFQAGSSQVGLLKTPEGAKAGVNHYCVSAAAFDYDGVVKQLASAGAKVEKPELAGAPEFRDPDGFLVQVKTAS